MGLNTSTSLGVALVCCVLVFSGLQMYRGLLGSTRLLTIIAGYISSWLFILLITAVSNLETIMFGKGFQAKLVPEVMVCLLLACAAAAMVHRVSVTVCVFCALLGLYYINKLSQSVYSSTAPTVTHFKKKKN